MQTQGDPTTFTSTTFIFGLDFSLNSPCVCVIAPCTSDFCVPIEHCTFHYFHNTAAARLVNHRSFKGYERIYDEEDTVRFDALGEWVYSIVKECTSGAIEGYAYSTPGQLTRIAESMGIVKYLLHKAGIPIDAYAPATIKKIATGNGRAQKVDMVQSFNYTHQISLQQMFNTQSETPISDIADAYFIACLARGESIYYDNNFMPEEPAASKPAKVKAKRKKKND